MLKNKFRKSISTILTLAFTGVTLHCGAANIVPINGGHVAVPPSAPVSKTNVDSKNPSGSFSLQAMKSKIDEVINPQKGKAEPRETYSGTCGDNCSWSLDTNTGKLTISGTGEMTSSPWVAHISYIKSVTINNGIKSICESAFNNCEQLTSVTIPRSVTHIYDHAFQSCTKLTSITIPSSVTHIGYAVLNLNTKLNSINVDISNQNYKSVDGMLLTKDGKVLKQCPGAKTSVSIPSTVTTLEYAAFRGCGELTSITIPNSVTYIGESAFKFCDKLSSVNLGNSVATLGNEAFMSCGTLTSITIPASVTSIGNSVFAECSKLNSINVDNGNQNYKSVDGMLLTKDGKTLMQCPGAKNSVSIPSTVTSIKCGAFSGGVLTSITIPTSVTSIDESVFAGCSKLTSINVDSGNQNYKSVDGMLLTKDGKTLMQCPGAKNSVSIPNTVISIGAGAFAGCTALTSINIPDSVTSIGGGAFSVCSELKSLIIPNSVISIGDWAFVGCSSLTSVVIPSSINSIGWMAFQNCYSLSNVCYLGTSDYGELHIFDGSDNLTEINVPTTYVGNKFCGKNVSECYMGTCGTNCFYVLNIASGKFTIFGTGNMPSNSWLTYKSDIKAVTIGDGVTSICGNAFDGCSSLISVTIPNSVTSIGNNAFLGCSKLPSISIPNTVTTIGNSAFSSCNGLTSITTPSSLTFIGSNVFNGCSKLTSVTLGNNYAVSKFKSDSFPYSQITSVTLGNAVNSISSSAFDGCSALTSVTIPDSVTFIGEAAFAHCSQLTNVTIPNSVESIGSSAFKDCSSLGTVNLGNNITSIEGETFSGCCALEAVTIPSSIESILGSAFSGCKNLTSIEIPNSVKSIGNGAFENCSALSYVGYLGSSDPGKTSTNVFDGCNKLDNVTVIKDYTDTSFCGMPISKREIYVEIKLDVGVKVNEDDVNEFIKIMCENSGISTDELSVDVKTDDENNVICILVYVNDEQTANVIVDKANECIKQ